MRRCLVPTRQFEASVFIVVLAFAMQLSTASAQEVTPGTGTYTLDQAVRGRTLYSDHCVSCHGSNLEGGAAPTVVGQLFRRTWSRSNVTVDDLHYLISTSMPPQQTHILTEDQYLAILAFILQRNGVPAGTETLKPNRDYLLAIRMDAGEPMTTAPAFIEGERGMTPTGIGPDSDDLLQAGETPENWLYHTRDYQGTRYSPLSQINTENVADLRPECIYQVGDPGNFQTGPIVYEGTMYVTGIHVTAAIDAATCRQQWRHVWEPQDREVWLNNRGVAIKDGYVVRATSDGYLFALDAADGTMLWARQVADPWMGETFTMAPMIFEDKILIGPAGSENAISGWVGAFRLVDGEPIWRFKTVPGATRSGGETWGNPTGIPLGGGAIWTPLSLDPDRGELYVAVTNPAPDLSAKLRPGPNLYTNSIVALDVRSGELRWYDQLVPADDHDWDLTQVSPVFRASVDGEDRDLVATVGKDGLLRILDRNSHERLYEVEVTTRKNVDAPVTTDGTYACPGILGGVEWNGPALHPDENLLITPAVDFCFTFYEAEETRYVEGEVYLGGYVEPDTDSWSGWVTAVNASDGSIRWKYRSPSPMLAAVTTTAGGLVLTGELTGDFLVLDVATGNPLYRFNTGGPIGGGLVSYEVEGRQYVAVASGRPSQFWYGDHPGSSTIVVFTVPQEKP